MSAAEGAEMTQYASPEIRKLARRMKAERTPAPAPAPSRKAARGPSPERLALQKAIEERDELRKNLSRLALELRATKDAYANLRVQLAHRDEALAAAVKAANDQPEPPVVATQPIHIEPQISVTLPDELRTIPAPTETIAERDKEGLVKRSITRALESGA
jgi:hypothetical protein